VTKSALPDRELDLLVAQRIFGWEPRLYPSHQSSFTLWHNPESGAGGVMEEKIPRYSMSIEAAFAMEVEIAAKYKTSEYANELLRVVGSVTTCPDNQAIWECSCSPWDIAHASPRDRCLAALKTMGIDIKEIR